MHCWRKAKESGRHAVYVVTIVYSYLWNAVFVYKFDRGVCSATVTYNNMLSVMLKFPTSASAVSAEHMCG